jgi:hypothetical protein
MGFPFLGGDLVDDLVRLLGWIDHMAVDDGMSASTVDTYISGAKAILLEQLVISDALGRRGEARHVWIQQALKTVATSVKTRTPFRSEWILEGRRFWPVPVYVAVVVIYMAARRGGEWLGNYSGAKGEHLLCWKNCEFLVFHGMGVRPLTRGELPTVFADAFQITFDSRKWQSRGQVRPIPPIIRLFAKPPNGNPAIDLNNMGEDIGLCAVTLLQSWFLMLRVPRAVDEQQPVMICADGNLLGSRVVIENMRAISSRHGADPKDVVVHSLKVPLPPTVKCRVESCSPTDCW